MITPTPNYDRSIARLTSAYKDAVTAILSELERMDITNMDRAMTTAALSEVSRILTSLNAESAAWVAQNVPIAARDGVARAVLALGVVESLEDAQKLVRMTRTNSAMVAAAIADTQADLLAVTQNIDRRVKAAVRKAAADSMRANMAAGINGRRTINRDTLASMRKTLGDSVNTGIIDAAGRRWKPEVYVDMLTRTKMMQAHNDATINEALARDVQYGLISRHGATDKCRLYEGKVVKLTPDAPGAYPYVGALPRNEIFHPNCRHLVSPVRRPETIEGGT
ncbi:phage minor capsid protein [Paenibacillus humicus]|uniref:phage minor capsid protein n=1 Tax=Paenibacillus humicus TaxID=412861 RepID=UPI000FD72F36|nr:phage minor capsid protein [Paenibacillus humicus]